jgi:hypothetical protein
VISRDFREKGARGAAQAAPREREEASFYLNVVPQEAAQGPTRRV